MVVTPGSERVKAMLIEGLSFCFSCSRRSVKDENNILNQTELFMFFKTNRKKN